MKLMALNMASPKSNSLGNNSDGLKCKFVTPNNTTDSFQNIPSFKSNEYVLVKVIDGLSSGLTSFSLEKYHLAQQYAKQYDHIWMPEYRKIVDKATEPAEEGCGCYEGEGFLRGLLGVCTLGLTEVINVASKGINRAVKISEREEFINRRMDEMLAFVRDLRAGREVKIDS